MLVYDRYVTDAERVASETYLNAKWLDGASGPVTDDLLPTGVSLELLNNGTLDLVGREQTFGNIMGSGTLTTATRYWTAFIGASGKSLYLIYSSGTMIMFK